MLPIFIFCCFLSLTVTANLKCHCDTNTTVGAYCEAKHDAKGELLIFDECKCKNGFENIQNKVEEQTVTVYCTNANTSSVRCFCDNKSALSVGNHCLANLNPSGIITYESGCKCSHPLATPSIIPEFFYSKIMVVHCTWNRKEDIHSSANNIRRFEYDKQKIRNVRAAEDESTSTASSTTTDSTTSHTTGSTSSTTSNTTTVSTTHSSSTTSHTTVTNTTTKHTTVSSTVTASSTTPANSTASTTAFESTTYESTTTPHNTTVSTTTVNTTLSTVTSTHTSTHTSTLNTTVSTITTTSTTKSTSNTTKATAVTSANTTKTTVTATVSGTTRNTTANATKASTVITTTPLWWAENDTTDENTFGVCNISKFSDSDHKTAEIILYIGSGWVVVWIFFTILYTMIAGVTGHHRFLDLFQELVLIIIFAFMGVFTMKPDWSTCTANKVVLQFCMMCILLLAMMQASFLSSLIKGRSSKNSRLPVMVNYIWPPFFAAVVAVVVYFAFKKYYDNNGVHCFCEIYEKLYWAYAFPAAILFFLSLMNNQMAVTACRMTRQNVDRVQLYWARRSCRGMPILITWFLFCFFCLLFAVDMQRVWLFGVYLGLCIIFGPMIFVLHTYCYEKSCRRLFETTGFTFYKPCPTKKGDPNHVEQVIEKVDLRKKNALTDPLPPKKKEEEPPPVPVEAAGVLIPPSELAPLPLGAPTVPQVPVSNVAGPSDLATNPTSSQEFYNWLTDKNNVPGQAENVLFKKNV